MKLKWNGTGQKIIDLLPGVSLPGMNRGTVILQPGEAGVSGNMVTDAEFSSMAATIAREIDAGLIVVIPDDPVTPVVPKPGMLVTETASSAEPQKLSDQPLSILEELLARTDAELAVIAAEYKVDPLPSEATREDLARAIMAKAGYAATQAPAEPPAPPSTGTMEPETVDPVPTPDPAEPRETQTIAASEVGDISSVLSSVEAPPPEPPAAPAEQPLAQTEKPAEAPSAEPPTEPAVPSADTPSA